MSKKLKTLKSIDVRSRFDFIDSFGTLFKNVIRKSNHDTLKDMVKQLVDFAIRINKEETEKGTKLSYNNDKIIIRRTFNGR